MSIPSLSTLQKIAVESYNPKAKDNVDGWILVDETPTLKFYMKGFETVVGIRGTFDAADASADAMIATGHLESSNRFKEDLRVMTDYANSHKQTNIFGVGHSLGGAILDSLLKKGLIKEGVSYNPAVQPQDFRSILPNRRIYMSGDPLYAIFGNFLRQKPEVRKSKTSLFSKLGLKSVAPEYLKSHGLAEFEGGKIGGALNNNQIGLSFIPAVLSSATKTRTQAIRLFYSILSGEFQRLRGMLDYFIPVYSDYNRFVDIPTLDEMQDVLVKIRNHGKQVIPFPIRDDPLGLRGKYGYGKCRKCGLPRV